MKSPKQPAARWPSLTSTKVLAHVRPDGAVGPFGVQRTFEFMLDSSNTPEQQRKEALRILRQIGYEARGVQVGPQSA